MTHSNLATIVDQNVGGHMTPGRTVPIDRIVLHHNAGTNFDAVPKVWQNRPASAHYQVGDSAIKSCVEEENTAWHAGNWAMNCRSIGIEHVNSTGAPKWLVSDSTQENSAKLVADICRRYSIPIDRDHIIKHSQVSATACPGGLKIDWVVNRAKELSGKDTPSPTPSQPSKPQPKNYTLYGMNNTNKGDWVNNLSKFMYATFSKYTDKKALGSYFGPYLTKSIKEFQRRTGLSQDGVIKVPGGETYEKLKSYGFKG